MNIMSLLIGPKPDWMVSVKCGLEIWARLSSEAVCTEALSLGLMGGCSCYCLRSSSGLLMSFSQVMWCSNCVRVCFCPQLSMLFTEECDKVRDLMHVHSFSYDFHLRVVHQYLVGCHMTLRQGVPAHGLPGGLHRPSPRHTQVRTQPCLPGWAHVRNTYIKRSSVLICSYNTVFYVFLVWLHWK